MLYKKLLLPAIFTMIIGLVGVQSEVLAQDYQQDRQDQKGEATLSGEVLDADTNEPIPFVEVRAEKIDRDAEAAWERDPAYTPEEEPEMEDPERTPEHDDPDRTAEQGLHMDREGHHGDAKTAMTDENGRFTIEGLEDGEYRIIVEDERYEASEETIELSAGDEEEIDLKLKSNSDTDFEYR